MGVFRLVSLLESNLIAKNYLVFSLISLLSFICTILFPFGTLQAQKSSTFQIPKIDGSISLDGEVNEPAWDELEPLPLVMHWPTFGNEPTNESEIRIGYNDNYLYLSCRCYKEPDNISAPTFKRDKWNMSMDQLAIILDTFDDNETAVLFVVTPTGSRVDQAIKNDGQGNNPIDTWNSYWSAETAISDDGWTAEMRIPFSSLRFQENNGEIKMGMILYRYNAKKSELNSFPEIPGEWGFWSFVKPSQAQTVVIDQIENQKPIYITPYALGGLSRETVLNDAETEYSQQSDLTGDLGLDVKMGLNNNLTLDLTLNTDFAQVEADAQQVNLTRFPLFFPEQRQFFLERSSVFRFPFGQQDRLFHSRRIGLYEGEPVQILGGARLNGRVGEWDIGALSMQTAKDRGLASENFSVLRFRKRAFNSNSFVGGILTSRLGAQGDYNVAYGIDGTINTTGQEYLLFNAAQTLDHSVDVNAFDAASARLRLGWERRTYEGFGYEVNYHYSGRSYRPGIGFQLRENYQKFGDRLFYGWLMDESSSFQRVQLSLDGSLYLDNSTGHLETSEYGISWDLATKKSTFIRGGIHRMTEDISETFTISNKVTIPTGRYNFYRVQASYETPQSRMVRAIFSGEAGGFFDGKQITASVNPTVNISRYLELGGFYQFSRITIPERNQSLNTHLARLRAEVTLNTKISMSTFIQHVTSADLGIINFRFRYNPRDGNDFYLVFNERLNTDNDNVIPKRPLSNSRALLVKYKHTFRF